jgi:two-component system LytT family response regulator
MAANDAHVHASTVDHLDASGLDAYPHPEQDNASYQQRLLVRSTRRVIFVRTREVEWCQACENYIQLHSGAQSHLLRGTMMHLEKQLDPRHFVRISRSAIVNLDFVREIRSVPARGRVVRLLSGTEINVGREYRGRLKRLLATETA